MTLVGNKINQKDKYGKNPLIYAAENGYYDMVETLIERGADINVMDNTGKTALIWAAKNEKLLVVESILKSNILINVLWKDQFDMTARRYAKNTKIRTLISEYMIDQR